MALPVTVQISLDGGKPLADYHSVSIRQELFAHHAFRVVVPYEMLEDQRADGFFHEAHERYCGKPIVITLTPRAAKPGAAAPAALTFKGVVTQLAVANSGDFAHSFVLTGFSPTYLLEDGTQRRTFVKKDLHQIFDEVLRPYPKNLVKHGPVQPQHQNRVKYAVQYGESNYAFLGRLADAYGEWFYYDGQQICLGRPADGEPLPFTVAGTENFTMAVELAPSRFVLAHYDYLAHKPYAATSEGQDLVGLNQFAAFALRQSKALFSQPARHVASQHLRDQSQLNAAARERKANRLGGAVQLQGNGENPAFGLGRVIAAHGVGANGKHHDYGRYRLVSVAHTVEDDMYENAFTALPQATDFPMPNPQVQVPLGAPELAEVVDVADPHKLGRVRVRFFWPVEKPADAESGWLRVATPYSGHGKGQLFTPEVGSQVLVNYEQHRAEFPVVVGNLFHPQNPQNAQYTTDNNQLKGIQTAGGNKLVFGDAAGAQTILISNSNNKGTSVLLSFKDDGSVAISTNGPIGLTAGKDITLQAGKNITLQADENIALIAKKRVSVEALEEDMALRAQKELLLTAVTGDLTLEAAKKTYLKADDDVEVSAVGLVKLNGADVKLNG